MASLTQIICMHCTICIHIHTQQQEIIKLKLLFYSRIFHFHAHRSSYLIILIHTDYSVTVILYKYFIRTIFLYLSLSTAVWLPKMQRFQFLSHQFKMKPPFDSSWAYSSSTPSMDATLRACLTFLELKQIKKPWQRCWMDTIRYLQYIHLYLPYSLNII